MHYRPETINADEVEADQKQGLMKTIAEMEATGSAI